MCHFNGGQRSQHLPCSRFGSITVATLAPRSAKPHNTWTLQQGKGYGAKGWGFNAGKVPLTDGHAYAIISISYSCQGGVQWLWAAQAR